MITPNHITALKGLWREKIHDPELLRKRINGVWAVLDNITQEQARYFSMKEQLVPGRTAEADWLANARAKSGANEEEDDENVKPLEKQDLPTELREFIDRRAQEKAPERPKDPVKAMESMMKRIKETVLPTLNDVTFPDQLPPPRAQVRSRGHDMTLEDALQHLSTTAPDSKNLKVQPTKSVDAVVNLAVERFSKV